MHTQSIMNCFIERSFSIRFRERDRIAVTQSVTRPAIYRETWSAGNQRRTPPDLAVPCEASARPLGGVMMGRMERCVAASEPEQAFVQLRAGTYLEIKNESTAFWQILLIGS